MGAKNDAAHALVTAAKAGDQSALDAIAQTIARAERGDGMAKVVADELTAAMHDQTRALYVARWAFGVGANGAPSNTGVLRSPPRRGIGPARGAGPRNPFA